MKTSRFVVTLGFLLGLATWGTGTQADDIVYPAGKVGANTAIGGTNAGEVFVRVCWQEPTPPKAKDRAPRVDTWKCVWVPRARYREITGGLPDMGDNGELPGKISATQAGYLTGAAVGGPSG